LNCIFCKIVNGEISARKIDETEKSLAFLDAFPLTKGHSLIIPKTHRTKVSEMSQEESTDLYRLVQKVATKMEKIASASLIAIHDGKESGQEVPHVHVHVIPRKPEDNAGSVHALFKNRPTPTDSEFDEILAKLKE